jgi:hypothetical protein
MKRPIMKRPISIGPEEKHFSVAACRPLKHQMFEKITAKITNPYRPHQGVELAPHVDTSDRMMA